MRNEFALLLVLVLAVVGGSPAAGAEQVRPAIIIISLVDDLGFSDIQPNGPWSPTPHMGELAKQGVVLRHMHGERLSSHSDEYPRPRTAAVALTG